MMPPGAPIVTADQMRAAEAACLAGGTTQSTLMARAGEAVAREAARFALGRPMLVLAGRGNGGDGFAAATMLRAQGHDVVVVTIGDEWQGAAAEMRAAWEGPVVPFANAPARSFVVDGLFGIGLSRAVEGEVAAAIDRVRAAADFVLAIDIASGLNADDGRAMGAVLSADATLALGALKRGHIQATGLEASGALLLAPIGIETDARVATIARPHLSAPRPTDHKYSRGLVSIVGGEMSGAARLSAAAAARGGAGYVVLASDDARVPFDAVVHRARADFAKAAAVLVGPGLGRDNHASSALDEAFDSEAVLVLDGDALALETPARIAARRHPTILTPHGGEFARLFGEPSDDLIETAIAAAKRANAVVILKGAMTVVATPDGRAVVAHPPSWLSTAGTGDVLAGLVAARAAVVGEPMRAACEAVWLHARAATLAGAALVADDLPMHLPAAIAECL